MIWALQGKGGNKGAVNMVDGVDGLWEIAMVNSVPTRNRFGLLEEDSDSDSENGSIKQESIKEDKDEEKVYRQAVYVAYDLPRCCNQD